MYNNVCKQHLKKSINELKLIMQTTTVCDEF